MSYPFQAWQAGEVPPKGWDCADAIADGWSQKDVQAFMRAAVRPWVAPSPQPPAGPLPRSAPSSASAPLQQLRPTTQEKPEPATVTQLHTRITVRADDAWQLKLVRSAEGKMLPGSTMNWMLWLTHHPDMLGVLQQDSFRQRVMLMKEPPWHRGGAWSPRELRESDYSHAAMWLETWMMTPKASNIAAVVHTVAEANAFDPLTDYLGGLTWDGEDRANRWLHTYLGAVDDEYNASIGFRFLISAVARALDPGCKVDTMPILEGPQGLRKSSALKALFSAEFFTDGLSDIGSKDAKMEMQGVWGLEVAEMQRFNAADTGEIKKFLTQQEDRFRPPYGRAIVTMPRRIVLSGSINPDGNPYLRDTTGGRRFWPVSCTRIDVDAISRDRDHLWAQALQAWRAGVPWWVPESELAIVEAEQAKRTDVDAWVDIISPLLSKRHTIWQSEIFDGLKLLPREIGNQQSQRVGRIMKSLGWDNRRDRSNGEDRMVYRRAGYQTDDAVW